MSKYILFTIILSTAAVLDLTGCSQWSKGSNLIPGVTPNQANNNQADGSRGQPSYDQINQEVIGPVCLACHHAGGRSPDLSTYQSVFRNQADILNDVTTGRMPVGGGITEQQKAELISWLNAGAPQNGIAAPTPPTTPTPSPSPDPVVIPITTVPSYADMNSEVFIPACLACHGGHQEPDLSTYAGIFKNRADILTDISTGDMPLKGSLTAQQKADVLVWLNSGAPEIGGGPIPTPSPNPVPLPNPGPNLNTYPPLDPMEAALKLNFNYIRDAILVPRCISCHDIGAKLPLADYATFKANSQSILEAVFSTNPSMPPFKAPKIPPQRILTANDFQVLYNYLIQGSPQGGDIKPIAPVKPTFDDINTRIFQVRCMDCHDPSSKIGRSNPLTKEGLVDPANGNIVLGNPEASVLIQSLRQTPSSEEGPTFMPLPSKGYTKVPQDQIDAIATWIKNGAKD